MSFARNWANWKLSSYVAYNNCFLDWSKVPISAIPLPGFSRTNLEIIVIAFVLAAKSGEASNIIHA